MTQKVTCPTSTALLSKKPHCRVCGAEMSLVRLVPIAGHMAECTFICPTCDPFPAKDADAKQDRQM